MSDPLLPMHPNLKDSETKYESYPPGQVTRKSQRAFTLGVVGDRQTIFCLILHAVLILAHVALIIVLTQHYERRVVVNIGKSSNTMSTVVTVLTQTIGTASHSLPRPSKIAHSRF